MKSILHDRLDRRRFVGGIAQSLLGVTVLPVGAFAASTSRSSRADSVIYLFMKGGMSHLDTFDLKPSNTKVQGPVKGISTGIPGLHVTEHLPRLAKQMDKVAQIRTMFHTLGNHEPGQYLTYTGYPAEAGVIVHPAIGSWVSQLASPANATLPINVRVGSLANHPLNGFFESAHAPLPVASPDKGLQNSTLPSNVARSRFQKRLQVTKQLDADFLNAFDAKPVRAYTELYDAALRMMQSQDLDAFDISRETPEMRERYGNSPFAQGCLLARRLTDRGVRFVEVDLEGWDSHTNNHREVAEQCGILDQPLAALLSDLAASGRLERTLVVVATEFGRAPFIDENAGRNHHPFGYTCLFAGAGAIGGAVHGATDSDGHRPTDFEVTTRDFNSTIAWSLGLDINAYRTPFEGGQKFSVSGKDTGEKGQPITAIFG